MKIKLKKTHISNSLIISLLFFLYMHVFIIKGTAALTYLLMYGVAIIFIMLNLHYVNKMLTVLLVGKGKSLMLCMAALTVWAIIVILREGTYDFSYFNLLFSILRALIRYIFLILLILRFISGNDIRQSFCKYFLYGNMIYVICTLIMVWFPHIKDVWFGMIQQDALYLTTEKIYFNRVGINGFAGYRETFLCSMGVILGLLCLSEIKEKREKKSYTIAIFFNLVGNFFYGRTGLVVSAICLLVYLLWFKRIGIRTWIILFLFSVIIMGAGQYLLAHNPGFRATLTWVTKPLIEILTTGQTSNNSFKTITGRMLFMPEWDTFFFGDGYYIDRITGAYYKSTDLGIMRLMLFGGIIASILCYSTILSAIKKAAGRNLFFMAVSLIVFAAFEYKGDIWYSFLPIYLMLIVMESIDGIRGKEK